MVGVWEEPTSWLTASVFLLCPQVVDGERELSGVSVIRTLIPSRGAPHS